MLESRSNSKATKYKLNFPARNTVYFDGHHFESIEWSSESLEKIKKIQYIESMISSLAHMAKECGEPFIAQILMMAQIEAKDNKNKLQSA